MHKIGYTPENIECNEAIEYGAAVFILEKNKLRSLREFNDGHKSTLSLRSPSRFIKIIL